MFYCDQNYSNMESTLRVFRVRLFHVIIQLPDNVTRQMLCLWPKIIMVRVVTLLIVYLFAPVNYDFDVITFVVTFNLMTESIITDLNGEVIGKIFYSSDVSLDPWVADYIV